MDFSDDIHMVRPCNSMGYRGNCGGNAIDMEVLCIVVKWGEIAQLRCERDH